MNSRAIEEPDVVKTMYENIPSIFILFLLTLQVNAKYVPATVRRRLSSLYYSTVEGILQQTYHVQYYQSYPDDRSPQRKIKMTTITIYHLQCGKHQVARSALVVAIFIIHILP